ncbi:MAG: hypothetical protein HC905_19485 [Bacteroidales bacterium]|nr:hypothetical protein [Bacteroidales bacterium]
MKRHSKHSLFILISDASDPRIFRHFHEDKNNNIWIGSNKGLLIWNNNNNSILKEHFADEKSNIRSIQAVKTDGNDIWVVSEEEIIGFRNPDNYYKIFSYTGLLGTSDESYLARRKRGLFAFAQTDKNNNLWVCTQRGLLHLIQSR